MRKQKNVEINGTLVTVKELTIEDIWKFGNDFKPLMSKFDIYDSAIMVSGLVQKTVDLKKEDLLKLSFSELDTLEEAWREVNASFLRRYDQVLSLVTQAGLKEMAKEIFVAIREDAVKSILEKEEKPKMMILAD